MDKETLGQMLHNKRREKGWDLERAHKETNISVATLKALEEDNYNILPYVYLKGAIKKYAQVLGLNSQELVKLYDNSTESVSKKDQTLVPISDFNSAHFFNQLRNILLVLSKSLIFLIIIGYLIYELAVLILPPKIILESPKEDMNTSSGTLLIKGRAFRAKSLFLNNQPILFDENKVFQGEIVLKLGLNKLEFVALNQLGQKSTVVRNIIYSLP